jgi:hypothetical protein
MVQWEIWVLDVMMISSMADSVISTPSLKAAAAAELAD